MMKSRSQINAGVVSLVGMLIISEFINANLIGDITIEIAGLGEWTGLFKFIFKQSRFSL